ncbi:hypothetical protein B0G73_117166 [Paraburkholderia sp. BL25I1N1]|nr:hypothetical protein B0G73_117166 [Paraburkholderia sp. BL25I1N1]
MRKWLQDGIDAEDKKVSRQREKIVVAMREYCTAFRSRRRKWMLPLKPRKNIAPC